MTDQLEQEEAALRRRLLFRMLRGFNFDAPRFGSEPISDPIPRHLVGRDSEYRLRQDLSSHAPRQQPLSP
jgi:hypothetical protein